jgi:hypothetical protein
MLHFIYIFSTNVSTECFKHAAHSPFFSSKCRLFHNVTFFGSFTFYIQSVLKFKYKTPVPKVKVLHKLYFPPNMLTVRKLIVRQVRYGQMEHAGLK